jgi:hypothetical protein
MGKRAEQNTDIMVKVYRSSQWPPFCVLFYSTVISTDRQMQSPSDHMALNKWEWTCICSNWLLQSPPYTHSCLKLVIFRKCGMIPYRGLHLLPQTVVVQPCLITSDDAWQKVTVFSFTTLQDGHCGGLSAKFLLVRQFSCTCLLYTPS